MIRRIAFIFTLLVIVVTCGCARRPTVISFEPKGDFTPRSGSDLLAEFNALVPFDISQQDFLSEMKSGRLVGSVIVRGRKERKLVRMELEGSKTLLLVQVQKLSDEMQQAFDKKAEALSKLPRNRPMR